MQIDLDQLFITMPARYGKLKQGENYTIQQILDYIDELGDKISKMETERELLLDEISDIREQVATYYRPASPYEITGLRESDFH